MPEVRGRTTTPPAGFKSPGAFLVRWNSGWPRGHGHVCGRVRAQARRNSGRRRGPPEELPEPPPVKLCQMERALRTYL